MENKELLQYINKLRTLKYSKKQILNQLISAGWDKSVIDYNLNIVYRYKFYTAILIILLFLIGIFIIIANIKLKDKIVTAKYIDKIGYPINEKFSADSFFKLQIVGDTLIHQGTFKEDEKSVTNFSEMFNNDNNSKIYAFNVSNLEFKYQKFNGLDAYSDYLLTQNSIVSCDYLNDDHKYNLNIIDLKSGNNTKLGEGRCSPIGQIGNRVYLNQYDDNSIKSSTAIKYVDLETNNVDSLSQVFDDVNMFANNRYLYYVFHNTIQYFDPMDPKQGGYAYTKDFETDPNTKNISVDFTNDEGLSIIAVNSKYLLYTKYDKDERKYYTINLDSKIIRETGNCKNQLEYQNVCTLLDDGLYAKGVKTGNSTFNKVDIETDELTELVSVTDKLQVNEWTINDGSLYYVGINFSNNASSSQLYMKPLSKNSDVSVE